MNIEDKDDICCRHREYTWSAKGKNFEILEVLFRVAREVREMPERAKRVNFSSMHASSIAVLEQAAHYERLCSGCKTMLGLAAAHNT